MNVHHSIGLRSPVSVSRRELFSIIPAGAAGCLGCLSVARCAVQASAPSQEHSWTEKADMTWEGIFRFAFQKEYIPLMKALGAQIGNEKFIGMLKEITGSRAREGMARNRAPKRDLATFVAGFRSMPPLYQHALAAEVVEDSPQAFEYRVSRCLWAKAFRDENAGDIGYAIVCYPDYAVASGFNPKLRLTRTRTLMQGDDHCHLRYEMDSG